MQSISCPAMTFAATTTFAATVMGSALTYFQAVVLGILQGVTELFPVSSLGHTVLFPTLFGWNELVKAQSQSESFWLAFVVMLHVGSALGLLFYYRRDWVEIVGAFFNTLRTRRARTPNERLAWLSSSQHPRRSARADLRARVAHAHRQARNGRHLPDDQRRAAAAAPSASGVKPRCANWRSAKAPSPTAGESSTRSPTREAFVIGTAQSAALVAGISRDGITMGAGLGRGLDHSDAARYAFLLATPIILAAGILKLPDLLGHLGNGIRGQALVACITAAITAVFTVSFLVRWFKTRTLVPFAIYGLVFGGAMVIYTQT